MANAQTQSKDLATLGGGCGGGGGGSTMLRSGIINVGSPADSAQPSASSKLQAQAANYKKHVFRYTMKVGVFYANLVPLKSILT